MIGVSALGAIVLDLLGRYRENAGRMEERHDVQMSGGGFQLWSHRAS